MTTVACPSCGYNQLSASLNTDAPIPGAQYGRYANVYNDEGQPIDTCPICDEELDARALLAGVRA